MFITIQVEVVPKRFDYGADIPTGKATLELDIPDNLAPNADQIACGMVDHAIQAYMKAKMGEPSL